MISSLGQKMVHYTKTPSSRCDVGNTISNLLLTVVHNAGWCFESYVTRTIAKVFSSVFSSVSNNFVIKSVLVPVAMLLLRRS